nr:MAG TPA: hypothetical protein [Caudoviricetes sp.]
MYFKRSTSLPYATVGDAKKIVFFQIRFAFRRSRC